MTTTKRTKKPTKAALARDERLNLRVSAEEKKMIEEASAAVGEDVSVWLRRAARELIKRERARE
jgi:uncharacterized protein (DUF1778 family)